MADVSGLADSLLDMLSTQAGQPGTLGYTIDGVFKVVDPLDPTRFLVRFENGTHVSAIHKSRVLQKPGLPVRVGTDALGRPVILGTDAGRIDQFGSDGGVLVGPHDHVRNSGREYITDTWLLKPLRVTVLSGTTVTVSAGFYAYGGVLVYFAGGTLDIAAQIAATSGYENWIKVGIDPTTNTLVAVGGTQVYGIYALDPVTIPAIAFESAGYVPLVAIWAVNGQALQDYQIYDLRFAQSQASFPGTSLDLPNTLVKRDANGSFQATQIERGVTTTATSAVTLALTPASTYYQRFTGTLNQLVVLPDATTLNVGHGFVFRNGSTGTITIQGFAGATFQPLAPAQELEIFLTANSTTNGSWSSTGPSVAQPLNNKTIDQALNTIYERKSSNDVSNPPTAAELNTAYGGTPGGNAMLFVNDNGGSANLYLAFYDAAASRWFTFSATGEALDAPTWSIPTSDGKYVSAAPDLTWVALPAGATYDLQISTHSDMSLPFVDLNGGTALSVAHYLTSGLTLGIQYYARVRQHTTLGVSPWSATRSFIYTDPIATRLAARANNIAYYRCNDTASYIAPINPALSESRNLVVNPTPSSATGWTLNANWAYASSKFTHTAGSTATVTQALAGTVVPGRLYKVVFTIVGSTTGTVTPSLTAAGAARTGNATFTDYIVATGTTLTFTPSSAFDGSISTFAVTRLLSLASSSFPLLEMLNNPNFDFDAVWTKGTGWTIAANKATHAAGTASVLSQNPSTIAGKSYVLTFTMSGRTAGTITPALGGTTGTVRSTNAPFTETIVASVTGGNLTLTCSSTFDGSISLTGCVPLDGLIPHDPGFEVWTNATTPTNWSKTVAGTSSVNQETVIVHSGSNAVRLDIDGSNSNAQVSQAHMKIGSTYLVMVWARADVASGVSFTFTGSAVLATFSLTAGYLQYSAVVVADATSMSLKRSTAGGHSIYFDDYTLIEIAPMSGIVTGAQLNQSTSNALADNVISFDGVGDGIALPAAVLNNYINFATGSAKAYINHTSGNTQEVFRLTVDASNLIFMRVNSSGLLEFNYRVGAVSNLITATLTNGVNHFVEATWDIGGANLISLLVDGVVIATAAQTTAIVGNLLASGCMIGASSTAFAEDWNGFIGHVQFCNSADTTAEVLAEAQLIGTAA